MTLYKYYITYNITSSTITQEVFPLGVDRLTLKDVRNEGRIFTRKELNGTLVFINQPKISAYDYNLFYSIDTNTIEKCGEISFEIKNL